MSNAVRVAVVCEGPTDKILLDDLIEHFLGHENFRSTLVQPMLSAIAGDFGPNGGGWGGVLRWCAQTVGDGIAFTDTAISKNNDLIIVHLDVDVTREPALAHLGLARPCPMARSACDSLRAHVLTLLKVGVQPANVVFCVPADSTEAWVIAALDPNLAESNPVWECFVKPESKLPLVQVDSKTVGKSKAQYTRIVDKVISGWGSAKSQCPEAARFESEFRTAARLLRL